MIDLWINYYKENNHVQIESASLIPENDPSVLFTTAGMHPLVPYLLGQPHPKGKRLCDVQKCFRTGDIDEVGDNCHCTFFEMLGNWSLGDYFKQEKVRLSYNFLTSEIGLNLRKDQFAVTCFEGDELCPRDTETAGFWEKMGVPQDRIFFLPKSENWWGLDKGPCGPDSEMFLDTGKEKCSPNCNPSCDCGKYIEIGNDVYMQFNKIDETTYLPAQQKNVDCGFGLERCLMTFNKAKSIYVTELYEEAIKKLEELSGKTYNDDGDEFTKSFRIVADHLRASTMIIGDEKGIAPSNTGAGYVLRRLIRRAIRHMKKLEISAGHLSEIAQIYINYFKEDYPEVENNKNRIFDELNREEEKFLKTIELGNKEFEKVIGGLERKNQFVKQSNPDYVEEKVINGKSAFRLFDTFGFPIEMTIEMATERGYVVDKDGFDEAFKQHQELARSTSAGAFKGGLADDSEWTTRLHTANHILLAGLRKMFGTQVEQKGSNITSERLRFDFNFERKLTDIEVEQLENYVNDVINKAIPVERLEMTFADAKAQGAYGIHKADENEIVSVYKIDGVDFQICGGPHANNTSELVNFKIAKQEAVSAGVRRIKAVINVK